MVDLSQYGLPKEPMPQELIAAGVSLVEFLRRQVVTPQAGIIVGKETDRPPAKPPAEACITRG